MMLFFSSRNSSPKTSLTNCRIVEVWYGHVLRRDDDSVFRVALNLEVSGKRKRRRPKKTWKKQVEEEEEIGLKEDALNRDKWRDGVRAIAEGMGGFSHPC